jgi:hypothetical protein
MPGHASCHLPINESRDIAGWIDSVGIEPAFVSDDDGASMKSSHKSRSPWIAAAERRCARFVVTRAMILEGARMKLLNKALMGVAAGAGFLAVSVAGASAEIVCSDHVCWHAREHIVYPPDAHIVVHEDNWRWGSGEKYSFREHEGHGYWRDGRWIAR